MAVGEARAPWYRPGRRASWRRAAGRLRGECPARFPSLRRRTLRALAAPRPCDPLGSAPEPTSTSSHPLGAARRRPAPETRRRAVPSRRTGGSSLVGCLGARGAIQLLLAWSRASPARDARRRMRLVRFPAFPRAAFSRSESPEGANARSNRTTTTHSCRASSRSPRHVRTRPSRRAVPRARLCATPTREPQSRTQSSASGGEAPLSHRQVCANDSSLQGCRSQLHPVTCTSPKASSRTSLSVTFGMTKKSHIKLDVPAAPLFLSHDPPISPRSPTFGAAAV